MVISLTVKFWNRKIMIRFFDAEEKRCKLGRNKPNSDEFFGDPFSSGLLLGQNIFQNRLRLGSRSFDAYTYCQFDNVAGTGIWRLASTKRTKSATQSRLSVML